jgi:hypothetical protein
MPFFVNPTAAPKTGCRKIDIDLLLALLPHAYQHTASYIRPFVEVRQAWYIEHKSSLGSCPDGTLIDALTPKKADPDQPSTSWDNYQPVAALPTELAGKVGAVRNLVEEM